LQEGKIGLCGVRQNLGGRIKCRVYGLVSGYAFDPIEKKPLYHYYPGKKILSMGSFGCNLNCNFCQNWKISLDCQLDNLQGEAKTGDQIISDALANSDNIGVAYTYNEPTVWFEFMYDTALMVKNIGLKNVMVSNGYINKEPLEMLLNVIDAFNIDLKAFTDSFYHEMAGGKINPVLESLKLINAHDKHLELTMLVIPRKNDDLEKFKEMVHWIQAELGEDTVLHLSRYFPKYKQTLPPTSEAVLSEMAQLAQDKLNFVYLGNTQTHMYSNTLCSNCKTELVMRNGFTIEFTKKFSKGKCLNCGKQMPILV
jgi:pyruvate formate lyase activating enzyme